MVVVDDDGRTGSGGGVRGALPLPWARTWLGYVVRPAWCGGHDGSALSLDPSWPIFSADEYGPRWACDGTPTFSTRRVLVPNAAHSSTSSGGRAPSSELASK